MTVDLGRQLERYSQQNPQEVLLVSLKVDGVPDQVAIFKGFSSSLMCPTAFDPDVPVIPDHAVIESIDRIASPYDPNNPRYIQRHMQWSEFKPFIA
ncbi:MAG: hypothetical protein HC805_05875 [Alkalinema sp. RL_2_19]|nr:hypothetical protein [Alkalinema sp. RL_2_19]